MKEQFKFFEWQYDHSRIIRGSLHITKKKNSSWFVFCHGLTGQRIGPGYLFVKLSRALSKQGFSSLRFDFFGSGESSGSFHEMSIDTMISDVGAVVKNLRRYYNPESITLIGHSFGGMIASLAVEQVKPDGLILIAPIGDPMQIIKSRPNPFNNENKTGGLVEFGPHEMNTEAFSRLLQINPSDSIAKHFKGNLLLIHGDTDSIVPVENSIYYSECAKRAGISTTYHQLKGTDHNFSKVSDVKVLCQVILSWAKEHFK